MVEGHQCHRVAAAHRRLLVGRSFIAKSPNGRFKDGAAAINSKPLQRIEVHGKNLFYFFGGPLGRTLAAPAPASPLRTPRPGTPTRGHVNGGAGGSVNNSSSSGGSSRTTTSSNSSGGRLDSGAAGHADADDGTVVMHVHFGMSGAFRTMSLPGPPPTDTTRLELVNKEMGLVAHLSAMTVNHGSLALYKSKAAQLGEDPLREDADKELLWTRVNKSRKPIGLVLMDQTMVAGVGNIYRAEILFKSGVHPELPACDLTREQFDRIWYHCVALLQRGFVSGSIITVDPEEAKRLGRPWTRRYIYNQKMCGRCKGPVRTWDMAARTVYCCETCQPLRREQKQQQREQQQPAGMAGAATADAGDGGGTPLAPARLAAMAAARPARLFRSHCAPDDQEDADVAPGKLTVKQLKSRLIELNLDTRGTKSQLVERLETALRWQQTQAPTLEKGRLACAANDSTVDGHGVAAGVAAPVPAAAKGRTRGRRLPQADVEMVEAVDVDLVEGDDHDDGDGDENQGGRAAEEEEEGDSAATLDRAEQALTDRMTADPRGAPASLPGGGELSRLTVVQLRSRLRDRGLPTRGTKATLLERLKSALAAAAQPVVAAAVAGAAAQGAVPEVQAVAAVAVAEAAAPQHGSPSTPRGPAAVLGNGAGSEQETPRTVAPPRPRKAARCMAVGLSSPDAAAVGAAAGDVVSPVPLRALYDADVSPAASGGAGGRGMYDIRPGIRGLEAHMASARDAAFEKLLAGENRAVEHVALEDDEVVDLLAAQPTPRARKRARSLAMALEAAAAAEREKDEMEEGGGENGIAREAARGGPELEGEGLEELGEDEEAWEGGTGGRPTKKGAARTRPGARGPGAGRAAAVRARRGAQ